MPAYITNQEYLDRFGDRETIALTDENNTGSVDTAILTAAVIAASEEVDGYLGKRYALPLSETPNIVKTITGSLARWELFATTRPESVEQAAAIARAQLKDLSRGLMVLPGAAGVIDEQASSRPSSGTSGDGSAPVFTDETLAGFGVSSGGLNAAWKA